MTIEDLEMLPEDGQHYELIDGELITIPPTGEEHNDSSLSLLRQFLAYVDDTGIGQLYIATQGFVLQRDPDTLENPMSQSSYLTGCAPLKSGKDTFLAGLTSLSRSFHQVTDADGSNARFARISTPVFGCSGLSIRSADE